MDAARDPLRSRERNPRESLWDLGQSILHELPSLIGDRVELLSLELQRASQALVKITVLATGAAILALTAWLALWGVLAGVLIALDWPPAAACEHCSNQRREPQTSAQADHPALWSKRRARAAAARVQRLPRIRTHHRRSSHAARSRVRPRVVHPGAR